MPPHPYHSTTPDGLEHHRDGILNTQQHCVEAMSTLTVRRGSTSRYHSVPPINRLPSEMLSMIFSMLAQAGGMYAFRGQKSGPLSIVIMQVCKLWTGVALGTQGLWQNIQVDTAGEWLATALSRSGNAPVDVLFHRGEEHFARLAHILIGEQRRLRSLAVLNTRTAVGQVNNVLAAMDNLPFLEKLRILDGGWLSEPITECFDVLVNDLHRFPGLRTLELRGLCTVLGGPAFRHLRSISCMDTRSPISITLAQFLDVLETCECLEELVFKNAHFFEFDEWSLDWELDRIVSLPRLRVFTWQWASWWSYCKPYEPYQIFSHLLIPATADVTLMLGIDSSYSAQEQPQIAFSYVNIPLGPRNPFPICTSVTTVRLTGQAVDDYGCFMDIAGTRAPAAGSIVLKYYDDPTELDSMIHYLHPIHKQVTDFCHLFDASGITSLAIEKVPIPLDSLAELLDALPELLHLDVWCEADGTDGIRVATLLEGLVADWFWCWTRKEIPSPEENLFPVCTDLRTLHLRNVPWDEHLLCAIFSCLVLRARQGASPLQALTVAVNGAPVDEDLSSHPMAAALGSVVRCESGPGTVTVVRTVAN
ncbi:hypothetical protein C8Q77DRAFT_1073717 [Trametes polyzona]|nr:hypothetical protein C8Q77DRAFT_1073717 [Trametes polyzona]